MKIIRQPRKAMSLTMLSRNFFPVKQLQMSRQYLTFWILAKIVNNIEENTIVEPCNQLIENP